jgi:hypothetical protein
LEADRLLLQIGQSVEAVDVRPRPRATHRPLATDFCRALQTGSPVGCSGWDGVRATQVIEVAYEAAR